MNRIALSRWIKQFSPPPTRETVRLWEKAGTVKLWRGTPRGRIYVIDESTEILPTADELAALFEATA